MYLALAWAGWRQTDINVPISTEPVCESMKVLYEGTIKKIVLLLRVCGDHERLPEDMVYNYQEFICLGMKAEQVVTHCAEGTSCLQRASVTATTLSRTPTNQLGCDNSINAYNNFIIHAARSGW